MLKEDFFIQQRTGLKEYLHEVEMYLLRNFYHFDRAYTCVNCGENSYDMIEMYSQFIIDLMFNAETEEFFLRYVRIGDIERLPEE